MEWILLYAFLSGEPVLGGLNNPRVSPGILYFKSETACRHALEELAKFNITNSASVRGICYVKFSQFFKGVPTGGLAFEVKYPGGHSRVIEPTEDWLAGQKSIKQYPFHVSAP